MATEPAEGGQSGGNGDDETGAAGDGSETTPVPPATVGAYDWVDYLRDTGREDVAVELYIASRDAPPSPGGDGGEIGPADVDWESFEPDESDWDEVDFDRADALGFDPDDAPNVLSAGESFASELEAVVDERTVNVAEDVDEDEFFSTVDGESTITNRYDLEKEVAVAKKPHLREIDRYWVNKPYAFVVLFHSERDNEKKYYLVEPYETEIESDVRSFLTEKLQTAIKYSSEDVVAEGDASARGDVIENETRNLLERYDLYSGPTRTQQSPLDKLLTLIGQREADEVNDRPLEGMSARPEPALLAEDNDTLSEYQVDKLLYLLKRNFIGYERIDGIKHDINVEDISCDGYNSPVFVYHTDHEQVISNVHHGQEQLDDFVVKLAQRSGKGISKRQPQVDATLPDGSRAQLTLGREVSDHGTNYTIRQFKDVPFTPVDLVNWKTFSLEEMAFLWLCIENHKSLIFAGGTASGKTTSLNAVSLFIPSSAKIVSIEDTREVELPQRNWIASVTRPSFSDDDKGDIDEFDLLEAALRQRPDYIVMGEIRGEEGRTLFQVMSTGHTTYTTFHADNVSEVIKRFTTEPINVSKTMFTALDLVSVQTQTRVRGKKVRRNKNITEINRYDPENDEINVRDVYEWRAREDEFEQLGASSTLDDITFDRGWSRDKLDRERFKREAVLAYLIQNGLNTYTEVAATLQAFINDQETILTLVATDHLEESLEALQEMESVLIDVDPEKEAMVPRPDPSDEMLEHTEEILEEAEDRLFDEYRDNELPELADALPSAEAEEVVAQPSPDDGDDEPDASAGVAGEPEAPGDESADAGGGPESDDGAVSFEDAAADDGASADASGPDERDDPFGGREEVFDDDRGAFDGDSFGDDDFGGDSPDGDFGGDSLDGGSERDDAFDDDPLADDADSVDDDGPRTEVFDAALDDDADDESEFGGFESVSFGESDDEDEGEDES